VNNLSKVVENQKETNDTIVRSNTTVWPTAESIDRYLNASDIKKL
jgi:hypothetical protein